VVTLHPVNGSGYNSSTCNSDQANASWEQPIYDHSSGTPVYTGFNRVVSYGYSSTDISLGAGDSMTAGMTLTTIILTFLLPKAAAVFSGMASGYSLLSMSNNVVQINYALTVSYTDKRTYIGVPKSATTVIGSSNNPPFWITNHDVK
jgi:hypothetical protein